MGHKTNTLSCSENDIVESDIFLIPQGTVATFITCSGQVQIACVDFFRILSTRNYLVYFMFGGVIQKIRCDHFDKHNDCVRSRPFCLVSLLLVTGGRREYSKPRVPACKCESFYTIILVKRSHVIVC